VSSYATPSRHSPANESYGIHLCIPQISSHIYCVQDGHEKAYINLVRRPKEQQEGLQRYRGRRSIAIDINVMGGGEF
jgi:hypothetical protein